MRVPEPGDFNVPHGKALVTGCAGFIGSRLVERLLYDGTSVVGIDSFTDYYAKETKKANLRRFRDHPGFSFQRVDLSRDELDGLLADVDVVYHLAGQPGVRASFGPGFAKYVRHNIEGTQRLLHAAIDQPIEALVYASSSSVYGDDNVYPTPEDAPRYPRSPYGMTKLAVEELAGVYLRNHGLPVVGLRYFTVFGPGQRPDMAFARFIPQLLAGHQLTVFGDGRQIRDFTYVDDAVRATIAAAARGRPGAVYNVAGGQPVTLREAFELLSEILERPANVLTLPAAPGDVLRTGGDGALAREELDFTPHINLEDGLRAQVKATLRELPKARRRARRWYEELGSGL
ncbi:MAG TPA: NAD-dependent epimerase/dehydratase family protein [Solirubrobacteraceae bacterium]